MAIRDERQLRRQFCDVGRQLYELERASPALGNGRIEHRLKAIFRDHEPALEFDHARGKFPFAS